MCFQTKGVNVLAEISGFKQNVWTPFLKSMILRWKLDSTVKKATFHPNWSDQMAFPNSLKVQFDSVIMQNRFPGDILSEKTYQHFYNRQYGDFRFFGLQVGLDHPLGCVQSWLRWNPSLTPFGDFIRRKPKKNRFFFICHNPQNMKNAKKGPKECFWPILSNLEKVDFFSRGWSKKKKCRYLQFFHEFSEVNRTCWGKNLKLL